MRCVHNNDQRRCRDLQRELGEDAGRVGMRRGSGSDETTVLLQQKNFKLKGKVIRFLKQNKNSSERHDFHNGDKLALEKDHGGLRSRELENKIGKDQAGFKELNCNPGTL